MRLDVYAGRVASSSERSLFVLVYITILIGFASFFPAGYLLTGLFYYVTISLALLFAGLAQTDYSGKLSKICLWISFSILFFVLGFRDASGIDDKAYQEIFENVNQYGVGTTFLFSTMEPGYLVLNYVVGRITDNYYIFQVLCTFIPLFLFYKGFEKYRNYISIPWAVLLLISTLYFQMLAVSLVRMFIAISIIFYYLDTLWTCKTRKYIFVVLVASLFHYSALIMSFFVVLTLNERILLRHWKKLIFMALLILPFVFTGVAKFAGSFMGERYSQYTEVGEFSLSLDALDTLPFLLFSLFYKRLIPPVIRGFYLVAIVLLAMSGICAICSAIVPLGRVIFYMNLSMLLLLPAVIRYAKNGWFKLGIVTMIMVYAILYLFVSQFLNEPHTETLFPYRNILFTI